MTNQAHSLGRAYFIVGVPQAQGAPLVDRCTTIEREGRMRRGQGVLVRIPFTKHRPTKGLVFGLWRKQ